MLLKDVFNVLILIIISIFDIKKFIIPNVLVLTLFVVNLLLDIFFFKLAISTISIKFVVMVVVFFVGYFLNVKYGLGMGDVKLLSVLAYIQNSIFFCLSVFSSSICGIIYLIFVKSVKKSEVKRIPYAPFIAIGTCMGEILRRFIV